jgi:serine/threonine-protein kinase RsbW
MDEELTRLNLPAEIGSLQRFTEFVRRGARVAALSEPELGQLELIIEEIVVNVMRHAYKEGTPGTIEVGYTVEGPRVLFVQISDSGREFNPLAKDPPDLQLSLAERPIGGLGIFLVKQFARSIEYRRTEDRNILSFRLGTNA